MNKDIKQKWVKALRSGEYKQGSRFLHYEDKFCCLGVLCDLMNISGPYAYRDIYELITKEKANMLILMNDGRHSSFNQIADWIDENLEVTES